MSTWGTALHRRGLLLAPLAAGAGLLAGVLARPAAAQEKATLLARRVDRAPADPDDELWARADILHVPMAPQAVVKPRTYDPGVEGIAVRALYDQERLAFHLEWEDATREAAIGGVESFRDAVALEFPAEPGNGIPYFAMGEPNRPVTIYQWKADWQFARTHDVDEQFPRMIADWYPYSGRGPGEVAELTDYGTDTGEKVYHTSWSAGSPLGDPELQTRTSIEKLQAEGFGTIASLPGERQDGTGAGAWHEGRWKVAFSVPRAQEGFRFEQGQTVPVAFAAWDGASKERGGEKAVSTWYFLSLERSVGPLAYLSPLLVIGGVGLAQFAGLRFLRRRASHGGADGS